MIAGVGYPSALAYLSGRYAIGVHRPGFPPPSSAYVGVLDARGALLDFAPVPGPVADLTRLPAAHAWMVVTSEQGDDGTWALFLRGYDDALDLLGEPLRLPEVPSDPNVALVALKSRLVALFPMTDGVRYATFAGRERERVAEGLLMRPGTFLDEHGEQRVGVATAAAAMRDTVVAVAMDRTDLWSVVLDPFSGEIVHGPRPFARSPARDGHDVAADSEGGTVGVCYPDGEGPHGGYVTVGPGGHRTGPAASDRLRFALLGPDGAPLGAPITIAAGLHNALTCAVAAAGRDRYVVVFWDAAGASPGHSMLAARVSVRR